MVIKKFGSFTSLENSGLNVGDRVMVHSEHHNRNRTGTILFINRGGTLNGDCKVSMDFGKNEDFFFAYLMKIVEIVEIPSGEVIIVNRDDLEELYGTGLINYNKLSDFYFFQKEDRWQIEYFAI